MFLVHNLLWLPLDKYLHTNYFIFGLLSRNNAIQKINELIKMHTDTKIILIRTASDVLKTFNKTPVVCTHFTRDHITDRSTLLKFMASHNIKLLQVKESFVSSSVPRANTGFDYILITRLSEIFTEFYYKFSTSCLMVF